MKIFNVALAFVYASVHSKQVAHAAPQQEASYNMPQDDFAITSEEGAQRYIVTYKKGSNEFNRRLQDAQSTHSHRDLRSNLFLSSPRTTGDSARPMFLPKEHAEVVYLGSEAEVMALNENDEVESVELGK